MHNNDRRVSFWLLAQGVEVNLRGTDGKTALMVAAEPGLEEPFKALRARGADPNQKEDNGLIALMLAKRHGMHVR
jgi:ankyrin repeat protein